MRPSLPVKPTEAAAGQIRSESRWWRRNRPKARNLFRDEIRKVFTLIAAHPEIGAIATDADLSGVRRVHMAGTHHYLYYRLADDQTSILVLAMWSTSRGVGPHV